MQGRLTQIQELNTLLQGKKAGFVAVTGRRRVGKTYLIDQIYNKHLCLRVTGIQNGDYQTQLINFTQKIAENFKTPLIGIPKNWQELFLYLKQYLQTLPTTKKQVIFLDELPWMSTPKSGFIQMLAHLWNDYLSKHHHFILVICGSSTSWITQKIVNDKGGFHNRITNRIHLEPFTLQETKNFLQAKNIKLTNNAIAMLYMAMGGIPYYLENIGKGQSVPAILEKMCFTANGLLRTEYQNLYKAIFDNWNNHEAIVATLAKAKEGLTRANILTKAKIQAGGPYQRAIEDLILAGFIVEEKPYEKKKRGALYRLVDEYSIFYHKFIAPNPKIEKGIWQTIAQSQAYKIWNGYAFETLCLKHIDSIKKVLGIQNVYTQIGFYRWVGDKYNKGFQVDVVIDRNDGCINLCECKFYDGAFEITKAYAQELEHKKNLFKTLTKTKKTIFTTLITNYPIKHNAHSEAVVDVAITLDDWA
jgi:uncharacterized protein